MSTNTMQKNRAPQSVLLPQPATEEAASTFGYDEMLTELEAIITDAQTRLADEDEAA